MVAEEESARFRAGVHPAVVAAMQAPRGVRSLAARVFAPERTALREARQAAVDVLLSMGPDKAKRFEADGVLYLDLGTSEAQVGALCELWEALCVRLDLAWLDDPRKRYWDRPTKAWNSRRGGDVVVHLRGTGGAVITRVVGEDELLASDDPVALIRERARGTMLLPHPPSMAAAVSLASAHRAVDTAEALAWEAIHAMGLPVEPPSRVVWRVVSAERIAKAGGDPLVMLRRGVSAFTQWHDEVVGEDGPAPRANPYDAVLAIVETGMLLASIDRDAITLLCPAVT